MADGEVVEDKEEERALWDEAMDVLQDVTDFLAGWRHEFASMHGYPPPALLRAGRLAARAKRLTIGLGPLFLRLRERYPRRVSECVQHSTQRVPSLRTATR
jgi:hypothetical protein